MKTCDRCKTEVPKGAWRVRCLKCNKQLCQECRIEPDPFLDLPPTKFTRCIECATARALSSE